MGKDSIRRQPVWIGVLLLGGVFATLFLADGDTATSWGIYEMTFGDDPMGTGQMCAMAVVCFPLQLWLLREKGEHLVAWLPLILPGVLFGLGELSWSGGGWSDRLMGGFLWYLAFFGWLWTALAVVLDIALRQKRGVKIAIGAVALVLVLAAAWFWPRDLGEKITLNPGANYVWCFKGDPPEERAVKRQEVLSSLRYLKVMPAHSGPEELFYGCKLLRLNNEYVLLAKDRGPSYIYRWSGPLEDFDGSGLAWRTSPQSAIYNVIY